MVKKEARLKLLRSEIANFERPSRGFWESDSSVLIPQSAVAELLGNARTKWLLNFFKRNPAEKILWCEREQNINPTAIYQSGVDLTRIKFINSAGDLQQPIRLALEGQGYRFVVAPTTSDEVRVYQRIQHSAERAAATVFFLAKENFNSAWPISLQLRIDAQERGYRIEVVRQKHGLGVCE